MTQHEDEPGRILYEKRDILLKGSGMVAHSLIQPGDLIVSEPPLLKVPKSGRVDEAFTTRLADILRTLDRDQQRSFFSLSNNYPKLNALVGIIKTNAMPLGHAADEGGIFPTCARFNHSCTSNAHYSWDDDLGREQVYATKSIAVGEEITVCYLSDDAWPMSRDQRLLHFQEKFDFVCVCHLCTAHTSIVTESDKRRSQFAALRDEVGNGSDIVFRPSVCLKNCHTMLKLLKEEDEHGPLWATVYYDALQVCVANGDLARASVFAELSADIRAQFEGSRTSAVVKMYQLAQNPQKHRLFGTSQRWKTSLKYKQSRETANFESWLWRRSD